MFVTLCSLPVTAPFFFSDNDDDGPTEPIVEINESKSMHIQVLEILAKLPHSKLSILFILYLLLESLCLTDHT